MDELRKKLKLLPCSIEGCTLASVMDDNDIDAIIRLFEAYAEEAISNALWHERVGNE